MHCSLLYCTLPVFSVWHRENLNNFRIRKRYTDTVYARPFVKWKNFTKALILVFKDNRTR